MDSHLNPSAEANIHGQEFSPGVPLRFGQPGPPEEATLTGFGEALISHSARTIITLPEGHSFAEPSTLPPSKYVGSSQPLPQLSPTQFNHAAYSLRPDNTRRLDYSEYQRINGVGPCGAVVEGTASVPMSHLNDARTFHVGDEKNHQENLIFPSCGSSFFSGEPLPTHQRTCLAERDVATAICEYASLGIGDKGVPAALITENQNEYNQDWSLLDMIAFNGVLIDEKVVVCQWVDHGTSCNHRVKGKGLKAHLRLRHDITSDSRRYACLWRGCSSRPMKKSSLERHVNEHHVPVKWACPTCEKTFTRRKNLMVHFERSCPGHVQPFVTYTGQIFK